MARNTQQREAIRKAITRAGRPLSPQEVHESARSEVPRLGLATVYRTLNKLLEDQWIVPVELPGESVRYERAGKGHHHHFHCRSCDQVYEVEGCVGSLHALTPPGFATESHEIVFYGLCVTCNRL